jgi:hypothetical protein
MSDFISDSIAARLKFFVKKISSDTNRTLCITEVTAFLQGLKDSDRVNSYSVDGVSANTPDLLAQGIFIIAIQVRTYASMDAIVLRAEIGESVTITAS